MQDAEARPQSEPLLTLGDLSRKTGIAPHRVKYALAAFNVQPVQRAGVVRLFSPDQLPHIKSCLQRIAGDRGGRREADHV